MGQESIREPPIVQNVRLKKDVRGLFSLHLCENKSLKKIQDMTLYDLFICITVQKIIIQQVTKRSITQKE